jgi:hypothetical protein
VTHKFTQCFILAVGALGLSALPALADSPCVPGPLSTYVDSLYGGTAAADFSCSVTAAGTTLDFSDFTYNTAGTNPVAVGSVGVSIATSPVGPGLEFDPDATITGANLSSDVNVGFTVTAENGSLISDVYLAFDGVFVQNGGTASLTEQFCDLVGACSTQIEDPLTALSSNFLLSSTALGGPVSSLVITKDLQLTTSGAAGSQSMDSGFKNEYSAVPEPRSISLILTVGLLAGFAFFKRRQVTQS